MDGDKDKVSKSTQQSMPPFRAKGDYVPLNSYYTLMNPYGWNPNAKQHGIGFIQNWIERRQKQLGDNYEAAVEASKRLPEIPVYLDYRSPFSERGVLGGYTMPNNQYIGIVADGRNGMNYFDIMTHELSHGLNNFLPEVEEQKDTYRINGQRVVNSDGETMSYIESLTPITKKIADAKIGKNPRIDPKWPRLYDSYNASPTEIWSRLMTLRQRLHLKPDYVVTKKDIKEWKKILSEYDFSDFTEDEMLYLFNEVADANNDKEISNYA